MKTILVTGGLGFIGTNVIAELLSRNAGHIKVFDIAAPDIMPQAYDLNQVELIRADLRDQTALDSALKGCDIVIHLAADTQVVKSMEDPEENFDVNARGTFNVLTAMRKHSVPYLINASTGGAILGEAPSPVHENMPARPLSPYGASKLAAEGYCSAFAGAYGLNTCSLRFSNVYGPNSGNKGSVIPLFIQKIMKGENLVIFGDGEQTRDFLYAEDLARAIADVTEKKPDGVYQLGTSIPTTINTLLDILKTCAGNSFQSDIEYKPFRPGEVVHNYCDISHARETFGYNPETSVEEGVGKTYAWFFDYLGGAKQKTGS